MSARHSKEVTDRIRSGDQLLSAFDVEGPRVAGRFLDETRPHLEEGDEEPRPAAFLAATGRKVRSSLDHLVDTDFAVVEAEGWESTLRHQFKDDKRELAFLIVAFRRLVLGQYVEPDLANLGLEAVNVRDGLTILRRGELVGERFDASNLAKMLGKSRFHEPIDLGPYVAEIKKKSAALLALSVEIDEAHRASDRARIARSRAKDAFDRAYLRAARIFEDTCRFCGLDDLADRVRRRQSRRAAAEDAVTEGREGRVPQHMIERDSLLGEGTDEDTDLRSVTMISEEEKSDDEKRTRSGRFQVVPLASGAAGDRAPDHSTADLPAAHDGDHAEVPGPARGRSGAGDPQPPAAHSEFLSRLLRPLRRQRPGVRPERPGAAGGRDRAGADRRPADRSER